MSSYMYFASTPAGSVLIETEADTFEHCVGATEQHTGMEWDALIDEGFTIDRYEQLKEEPYGI